MDQSIKSAIEEQLEDSRKELLDLGMRNKLLNYRTLKTRGGKIVDELSEEVYRILVKEVKTMYFLSAPEEDEDGNGSQEEFFGQPDEEVDDVAERHTDNKLQTPYNSVELQNRLLKTYYMARRVIEEQGVNVLYIALGMLHWYESVNSNEERIAPLVLVPVDLNRKSAKAMFRVSFTGEDIGDNLSLKYKLQGDFGISLPEIEEETEDIDIASYFAAVEKSVGRFDRWSVTRNEIAIGLFSFNKFLMYEDLNPEHWPQGQHPAENGVLRSLLSEGFSENTINEPDGDTIDDFLQEHELTEVVDADSSQSLALLDVKKGNNLVIQGPPGTGKSQTITNLIAEAILDNKTVLFVSEKMAALEVVKRKMDTLGIGDSCLELHSHKTRKKDVLDEIERTFRLGKPDLDKMDQEVERLKENTKRLNEYAKAANSEVKNSGRTPHQIYGRLTQLNREVDEDLAIQLSITRMEDWSNADFDRILRLTEDLDSIVQNIGLPEHHPFWGAKIQSVSPEQRVDLKTNITQTIQAFKTFKTSKDKLADIMNCAPPQSMDELETLYHGARLFLKRPNIQDLDIANSPWIKYKDTIANVLELGRQHTAIKDEYREVFLPEAWGKDVLELRQDFMTYGEKWWKWFSKSYREARTNLQGLLNQKLPKEHEDRIELIDLILEESRLRTNIESERDLMESLFQDHWNSLDSEWERLLSIHEWIQELHGSVSQGKLPDGIINMADKPIEKEDLESTLKKVQERERNYREQISKTFNTISFDESTRFPECGFFGSDFQSQESLVDQWKENLSKLQQLVRLNHIVETLNENGLSELVEAACGTPEVSGTSAAYLECGWLAKLLGAALQDRPILARFDRSAHEDTIEQFRNLDQLILKKSRAQVAMNHWEGLPRNGSVGQVGVLYREFEKKRRHLPIRKLMKSAGDAIQAIKPVFMMSPLSIAKYIPPGVLQFDLVVFDEASQVKPVEAFGALLRGKQAVVVGDTKQLPPTEFFETDALDEDENDTSTRDIESILGLFNSKGAPERMLRWHYRSRHESLIAVSNMEFYDNKLVFFPSPDRNRTKLGVKYNYLPDTTYDRGGSRQNKEEAQIVAQAVMDHARNTPNLTLGVASFNQAQMQCIQDHLEYMRRKDQASEEFFHRHPAEPFFVKNLENVQGDQRDVIFISVGYGRDQYGKVSMNFGPLNKIGGERRLNVLITRAKLRCEIFTNLRSEDIRITNAQGLAAFKRYLQYANSGELDMPEYTGGDFESPFEKAVAQQVHHLGYKVIPQVGAGGFRIDLGVIHPEKPGQFLLGIECDGATYHSARTARDRDRIRQLILEKMGWKIHRIWSTDWYNHQAMEVFRLEETLKEEKGKNRSIFFGDSEELQNTKTQYEITREMNIDADSEQTIVSGVPYNKAHVNIKTYNKELHEIKWAKIGEWISEIAQVEAPIHIEIVGRRIIEGAGVTRLGRRIRESINHGARNAQRRGFIKRQDDFIYKPNQELKQPRDRSSLSNSERSFEYIAPDEVRLAIEKVVDESFGINKDDLMYAISRIFGFSRITQDMEGYIKPHVQHLINIGTITKQGEYYSI